MYAVFWNLIYSDIFFQSANFKGQYKDCLHIKLKKKINTPDVCEQYLKVLYFSDVYPTELHNLTTNNSNVASASQVPASAMLILLTAEI
jgi:hypothetical protein